MGHKVQRVRGSIACDVSTRLNHDLSTHLFWQAGVTAVFAPFAATGGTSWVLLVLLLAAASCGLGAYLRSDPPQGRTIVLAFEAVAVLVAGAGVFGGHYVPGSIVGAATLLTAARSPAVDPEPTNPLSALIPVQAGTARVTYAPVAAAAAPTFAGAFPATTAGVATAHLVPAHAGVATSASGLQVGANGAAPVAAVAIVPAQPAGQWAADPTGRHHYRWWDGGAWTAHVSTNGASGVDPV